MKYPKSILFKFIALWKAETGEDLTFSEAEKKINDISLCIDPMDRMHNSFKRNNGNEIDNLIENEDL